MSAVAEHEAERDWFLARVIPEPMSGCWLWLGETRRNGYGRFRKGNVVGSSTVAHRFAYELWRGPIPKGLVVDHLCRTTCCVNPDHLEAITGGENTRRGIVFRTNGVGRFLRSECPQGHALTPDNLRISRDGKRRCRKCISQRHLAHMQKNPELRARHAERSRLRRIAARAK